MTAPLHSCEQAHAAILQFMDGEQGPREALARRHLDQCADCRSEAEEMNSFESALRGREPELNSDPALEKRFRDAFRRAVVSRRAPVRKIPISAMGSVAAMVLVLLGFWQLPRSVSPVGIEMAATTRGLTHDVWTAGERFRLRIRGFDGARHVYVVNLDAGSSAQFYFPHFDVQSRQWDYLGYSSAEVEGGSMLVIPSPDYGEFSMSLSPGNEAFLAVSTRKALAVEELDTLRRRLQRVEDLDELKRVLEREFGPVSLIRYEIR